MKPRKTKSEFENIQKPIKRDAIARQNNQSTQIMQWNDLPLRSELMVGIKHVEFQFPSQIQYRAIPQIIAHQDRDVLCQSKPGTGKTAVFILSILNMLTEEIDGEYLTHQSIVAVSTRELAHQVFHQFRKLSVGFVKPELRIACYFGGLSLWDSKYELKAKKLRPHIIIGTLGRLRHLISQDHVKTEHVKYLVIDQCDKIMDNSQNLQDLKYLLKKIPKSRQMLLFTATLPSKTRGNCLGMMKKSKQPFVLAIENSKADSSHLKHYFKRVSETDKFSKLCFVLDTFQFDQVIVFVNVIEKAMGLTDMLKLQLFNPVCIHSKLPQAERLQLYDRFRHQNSSRVLVATDIFGRGIDIGRVNLVINYDFPKEATMYLHRAARAGRFGKRGAVVSFIRAEISEDIKISRDQCIFQNIAEQYKVEFAQMAEKFPPNYFN